ncbi:N-ethylammeline chlorohydrolase [Streptococcus pneumoniae]|nr:N-ethylammeline chlorohydrolase [Streptococcus pneumoniae]VJB62049.1 N-ethylammeline chlorohydrolase [Streptococcus pneumoniae]VJE02910.1 N-ethylammeline chlorohydrolase [Streptococcus pneumoniae]VND21263.1 N-ethylammeline chlorohydrolase [Streptococcus pneumoniae]VPF51004.1 N-ethylammeline chlorohydrolase [Streptococcus pneumoniae]
MRFIVGRFTSFSSEIELLPKIFLYSIKIKVQTRKLAAGCSKHCFEVVDRTDEVSSKHGFEVVDETDEVSSKHGFEVADRTDEVSNHTYGKATLTWFEEIFEEY